MNIKEIISACQRQDRRAQKSLYDLYVKLLMSIALRYVKDLHTAKDIVQETLIRFFRSIHRLEFENKKALDAYFRKTTVNESIRWLQKNRKIEFLDISKRRDTYSYNEGESDISKNELLLDIKELPDGYRIIFNMYAIEGYAHKEIAAKLNISEGTSRSQLARARAVLQQKILNRSNYVKRI